MNKKIFNELVESLNSVIEFKNGSKISIVEGGEISRGNRAKLIEVIDGEGYVHTLQMPPEDMK